VPVGFIRRAFTLVELMIVVAIIGLLAAIAVPGFVEMQMRAKRAELSPNVQSIKSSEIAYEAAMDGFLSLAQAPSALPGKTKVDWVGNPDFTELGWAPDGGVRGCYSVTTSGSDFVVLGKMDADGDSITAEYTATHQIGVVHNTAHEVY
jgi:prepilin-type N-terminal cleavage/methylation domain-containing protein